MDRKFLTAAALAAACTFSAAPAGAQHWSGMDRHKPAGTTVQHRSSDFLGECSGGRDSQHARRGVNPGCSSFGESSVYADGEWALYNNRSWDPDSYNDWWRDRPDRAFPRWVVEQRTRGTCSPDRMWWSGSGWHC